MNSLTEQLLDWAPTGIVGLDLEGRILFANPAAAALFGASKEDLVGQPVHSYVQFMILGAVGEDECLREDGTSFPIEYQSAPMLEDGRHTGTVVTLRDISERRAADRAKNELISVVSHELRTPLTSIRSAIGLLVSGRLGALPQKGQRMLEIAVSNTDRLIRLINDMLDLERLASGDLHVERVPVHAGGLMLNAIETVRTLADAAQISLNVKPADAHIVGDPDRLLQVLINLLANAIKFSPTSGGSEPANRKKIRKIQPTSNAASGHPLSRSPVNSDARAVSRAPCIRKDYFPPPLLASQPPPTYHRSQLCFSTTDY